MTKKRKKLFGGKKLIPAIAMLTVSAIMLSTATYAWFTMNKEAQVKGLTMNATAGEALEISLGAITADEHTTDAPGKDDTSWKSSILIDDYYALVGRLQPASSDDALQLFKVASTDVSQGGRAVKEGAAISTASEAALTLDKDVDPSEVTFKTSNVSGDEGNYIDVPMWIRTNKSEATNIGCEVKITDPSTSNGSDLIKAVRVAILPTGKANTSAALAAFTNAAAADGKVTLGEGLDGSIFANDAITYHDNKVIGEATGSTYASASLVDTTITTDSTTTPKQVFTIPAATNDDYAGVAFIARVWLEGESTSCNDSTANQDWNIDFKFSVVS